MVSISYGKIWGEKTKEIADLKIEKQELLQELSETKARFDKLVIENSENQKLREKAESQFCSLKADRDRFYEITVEQSTEINCLKESLKSLQNNYEILKLNSNDLQSQLDTLKNMVKNYQKLEIDLRNEIKFGDSIRHKLEQERDALHADLEKKNNDFETLSKSKEHSERHIAILLKEKDRILNKNESKPLITSKIFQTPSIEEKVTSWGQVENQRLKSLLEEEKKENQIKTLQIEKLQKENWGLINRLRNKKGILNT